MKTSFRVLNQVTSQPSSSEGKKKTKGNYNGNHRKCFAMYAFIRRENAVSVHHKP